MAGEVKSLESAIAVRSRVLDAFERAEATDDPAERDAELTFVVVGAGPTGAEIAGQIGELARDTLRCDFSRIHSGDTRILLVEMGDRILSSFPPSLSARAARSLGRSESPRPSSVASWRSTPAERPCRRPIRAPSGSPRGPSSGPPG